MTAYDPAPKWITSQVMLRDATQTTPVEDVLVSSGVTPTPLLNKLKLLRQLGWPDARRSLHDDYGHRIIARAGKSDPPIWLLKLKPHCWRLYFYVYEQTRNFAFLHAICKKTTPQNAGDAVTARNALNDVNARRCDLTDFPLEAE